MRKRTGLVSAYVCAATTILLTTGLGIAALGMQSMKRVMRDRNTAIADQATFATCEYMVARSYDDLINVNNGKFVATTATYSSLIVPIAPGATATAWITPESSLVTYVTATVTYKGIVRSVRRRVSAKDVGIWNNAVFAGSGASGQAINGNVDIRGSVHILGEGEPYVDLNGNGTHDNAESFVDKTPKNGVWNPGETFTDANGDGIYTMAEPFNDTDSNGVYDPPMTQTSLDSAFSGNAYVGNNYSGIPSNILNAIPSIPTVGGVATLGSEVRVKHGLISVSGSATLGTSSIVDGGLSKATLDGSFVSDGYTGTQGINSVYSDNGTTNGYDLGSLGIAFPIISGIGAQTYIDKTGASWTTHQTYLDSRSLTIPVSQILANTTAFSYGPDAYGNKISFVPGTPGVINTTGVIKIVGDLQLGGKNSNLTYTGSGTIYTTGTTRIDGDLLPAAGKVFPTTTRLGLIAGKDLMFATGAGSSQLSMAGAFYAQGTIVSAKQNRIAGTFVASFFDLGTNVPSLYQVPSLPSNMPPAMPGDKRYFSIKALDFRDRSPLPGHSDTFNGGNPFTG